MKPAHGLMPAFWKDGRFGTEASSGVLFGQTRDDVEVERWLIERHGSVRRVVVITSGGCAPLTLLDVVGEEILSVDINPAQNRLAERKFVAWRESERELESLLRDGLFHCGRLDRFSRLMRLLFFATVHHRSFVERFLLLDDRESQRAAFVREWNTWRWRTALAMGFHPRLLRLTFSRAAARHLPGDFATHLEVRLREWLTGHPARSNPFLWQSFLGKYPPDRATWPRYFQSDYRQKNLANIGKVKFFDGDVTDILAAQPQASLEFLSLSNVLELVADPGPLLAAAAHAMRPGGLLLSRGILPAPPQVPPAGWAIAEKLRGEAEGRDRGGLSLPVLLLERTA